MSDNWVVQNLQNALDTWNKYLSEIWQLITQSPEQFKGGSIWSVIVNIHDAVRAIGLALFLSIKRGHSGRFFKSHILSLVFDKSHTGRV